MNMIMFTRSSEGVDAYMWSVHHDDFQSTIYTTKPHSSSGTMILGEIQELLVPKMPQDKGSALLDMEGM